ncbi:hypothetical protein [Paenibacillus sp. J2TS4]|uniref:hypothetical protein n=1 Tax=Paenibacillus sp. J2TS4 TaxID=2807194 RepID=UPI001B195796|nr:hypothetical protein [Paenibacillus sp. J2TS4]GIP36173.1 hypothetical protein J2TS4_53830 [Paenibacillus sp. J2TS4]
MSESLSVLKRIPHTLLEQRLETVQKLNETKNEAYELMKDNHTGEHYLMYHYLHLNLAEGGHKETYFHFMPVEHDDVLAIVLGEQEYTYPKAWIRPYLRNSSVDDSYVWFDPAGLEQEEYYERLGHQLNEHLIEFKRKGKLDPDSVHQLMKDLDKL